MLKSPGRAALPRILLAVAFLGCGSGSKAPPAQSFLASVADFQNLRRLEGTWRGTNGDSSPFYEGYHFETDTLIRILHFPDSTTARAIDSGSVYLRAGNVYHESGSGLWRADRMDSISINFEPRERATNSFTWVRQSPDSWVATLRNPGGPEVVYHLQRLRE